VTLAFDLLFKSSNKGMAVNGLCQGHLCFTKTSCFGFFVVVVFFFNFNKFFAYIQQYDFEMIDT
jgi:hypothetical protein